MPEYMFTINQRTTAQTVIDADSYAEAVQTIEDGEWEPLGGDTEVVSQHEILTHIDGGAIRTVKALLIEPDSWSAMQIRVTDMLEDWQGIVGGDIEVVYAYKTPPTLVLVNENGIAERLPLNEFATRLFKQFANGPIYGNALIVGYTPDDGEFADVPVLDLL